MMYLTRSSQRQIGIILSYIRIVLQTIIGVIYVPLLLHFIGRNEYGLYELVGSFIAYFGVMDFGLSSMVTRFYAKYLALDDRTGMENILAIALRAYIVIGIFVLLVGVVVYSFLGNIFGASISVDEIIEGKQIFLLLLGNLVLTIVGAIFSAVITARQEFLFLNGMQCIYVAIQPIVVLLVLMKYPCALAVATVNTILNILLIFTRIYYSYFKLHVSIKFHFWNKKLIHEISHYMLAQFLVTITDIIFFNSNQVILGIVQGTAAVAIYSISNVIRKSYMVLSTAICGVYLPHVTEMMARTADKSELSDLFIKIGRMQFFVLAVVAAGFVIFGREFIHIWVGDGFEEAYVITLLIILPFTTDLIQNLGFAMLQAVNRYEIRSCVQTVVGVVNIILAIPLGIKYGGTGCALATGICMFLGNGIGMTYCYGRMFHIDIARFWREILVMTFKVIILASGAYLLDTWISRYIAGNFIFVMKLLGFTSVYCIYVYGACMNHQEKMIIRKMTRRN